MKTIFIKVASILLVISMLTSCLGDGDNYIEVSEDFAYIKTDDLGSNYAMTYKGGPIKADKIQELIPGSAYYVSYKAGNSNGSYAVAERFDLLDKNPVPKAGLYFGKPYFNLEHQINDTINPKSMELGAWYPFQEYFDDNWEIRYNVSRKLGDEFDVYFYYDNSEEGQSENGEKLKDNQVIIDVRFVKSNKSGSSQDDNSTLHAMGSLKMVREMFRPVYKEGYADVAIKFRYIRDNNGVPTVSYIGSFYSTGTAPIYFIRYIEES